MQRTRIMYGIKVDSNLRFNVISLTLRFENLKDVIYSF